MRIRLAVRYVLRTVAVLSLGASFAGGCSRQGEGERCDFIKAAGSGDCDSGLVCKRCEELQDGTTDRCCPAGTQFSDSRCQPGTSNTCSSNTGTGGSSATGGSSGSSGTAGNQSGSGGTETGGSSGTEAGGTGGTDGSGDVAGQAGDAQAGTSGG
jgi:hypothetical protein